MGAIEGVILLSSTNELILNSHFSHPLTNYPALHVDNFVAKLEASSGFETLSPVLYTDSIPNALDINYEEDEDETQEQSSATHGSHATQSTGSIRPRGRGAALVHIEHNRLRFLATFSEHLDPLKPLTFLKRLVSVMELYFGSPLTEEAIRDNFDVVYQLLEEMLDESGEPLNTEYNTLRELVREPSWFESVVNKVGALSGISTNVALGNAMSQPQISTIPWRRPIISQGRQARHEIYMDIVETLSAIFSRGPHPIPIGPVNLNCTLIGESKLGGTPDVHIKLNNSDRILDASLHACVRLRPWEKERVLKFVPPDGQFDLASFRLQSVKALQRHNPLLVACSRVGAEAQDDHKVTEVRIVVSCSAPVEDVEISFGVSNTGCSLESSLLGGARPGIASEDLSALKGTFHFDARIGLARWTIGSLSVDQRPLELRATIGSETLAPLSSCVTSNFTIGQKSLSGVKIASMDIINDVGYKPFKGVRAVVKGSIDWRW